MTFWVFIMFLALVVYQDFKERMVYWWVFPLLLILAYFTYSIVNIEAITSNFLFVITQLLGVTLYIRFREKQWLWMGDKYLGLGDILFFLLPVVLLAPANFVVFFMSSLLLGIFVYLIVRVGFKKSITIPLAGLQASMMMAYIGGIQLNVLPEFNNDAWVLK